MANRTHHAKRWREEGGQDVLEWSSLLLLISAIFTLMFALGIPGQLGQAVTCALDKIFRIGPCSSAPAYPVTVITKTVGYDGRFTFVDDGHQYVVTLTKLSDGTAEISLVNTASLGLSARAGASVELGPLGTAEAQAQAGGGVYINGSTTWTFPNWATAQREWKKVSSGDSLGLAVNDAANSFPIFGSVVGSVVDSVTGAQGAPTVHSISKRYLSATAVGAGVQGTASAGAGADLGPLNADIKASISAKAGLERINSGPQKGDWQGSVQLSGDGDGSLSEALFGGHLSGVGSVDGEATVTFGPDFTPQELEVTATGNGVWDGVSSSPNAPDFLLHSPHGSDSGSGSGSSEGSKGAGGEGEKPEAPLEVSHQSPGGSGVGSTFVGQLDLTDNPTAQAALVQVLQGNTSQIPVLIDQMNNNGTEYIQTYRLDKSTSAWGGQVNVGGGGGLELKDGSSTACYAPPKVRQRGGAWTTSTFDSGTAC